MQWTDPDTGEKYSIYPTEELEEDLRAFHQSECPHERAEWRRARDAAGMLHVRRQCLACGALVGTAISKASAPAELQDADAAQYPAHAAARSQRLAGIYRKHAKWQARDGLDFKAEHAAYLRTPEWQLKRVKVLERANGLCEGCRERSPSLVHHVTYEHWRDELLFELVALCDPCHRKCHHDEPIDVDDGLFE